MLPVRCKSRVRIAGRYVERGCGAVLIAGEWCYQRPGLAAQDNGLCPGCADLVAMEQEQSQRRLDRKLLRDRARGYAPDGGDPFRGMDS